MNILRYSAALASLDYQFLQAKKTNNYLLYYLIFPSFLWSGEKRTGLLLTAKESRSLQLPSCHNSSGGAEELPAAKQSCFKLNTAWAGPRTWRGCWQYLFGQGEVSVPDLVPWLRGDSASLPKSSCGELSQSKTLKKTHQKVSSLCLQKRWAKINQRICKQITSNWSCI